MNAVKNTGLLIARLIIGAFLTLRGFQKLGNVDGFLAGAEAMGAPAPQLTGWLIILGETGLGILLVLGLATRIVGVLMMAMFAAIYATAHTSDGLFAIAEGGSGLNGEPSLMYFAFGVVFLTVGGGAFAVDHFFSRRKSATRARVDRDAVSV